MSKGNGLKRPPILAAKFTQHENSSAKSNIKNRLPSQIDISPYHEMYENSLKILSLSSLSRRSKTQFAMQEIKSTLEKLDNLSVIATFFLFTVSFNNLLPDIHNSVSFYDPFYISVQCLLRSQLFFYCCFLLLLLFWVVFFFVLFFTKAPMRNQSVVGIYTNKEAITLRGRKLPLTTVSMTIQKSF